MRRGELENVIEDAGQFVVNPLPDVLLAGRVTTPLEGTENEALLPATAFEKGDPPLTVQFCVAVDVV